MLARVLPVQHAQLCDEHGLYMPEVLNNEMHAAGFDLAAGMQSQCVSMEV